MATETPSRLERLIRMKASLKIMMDLFYGEPDAGRDVDRDIESIVDEFEGIIYDRIEDEIGAEVQNNYERMKDHA